MTKFIISQKKTNQKYLSKLISSAPKLASGRKKYDEHYNRILKNLLLIKSHKLMKKKKLLNFFKNDYITFIKKNGLLSIKIIVKKNVKK